MSYYSEQGYDVYIPVDQGRVDFIAHKDDELIKVQVKTAGKRRYKDKVYSVAVLTSRRGGNTIGHYQLSEVDECFVVDEGVGWRIPYSVVYPSKTVMLAANTENYIPTHGYPVDLWRVTL